MSATVSTSTCNPRTHAEAPYRAAKTSKCPDCDWPRCIGKSSRSGARCRKQPIKGANVCRTHGGSAPQVQRAAARRLEERKAILAAETFGLPREVDPHTALIEELHRTAGAVAWLGAIVADIRQRNVMWGRVREKTGGEDYGTTFEARTNAWVAEWQRERKHLLVVAKTCVDVGIEERRVRLAEDAGRQLASVMRAVLDRLELSDEQRGLAAVIVPEEFRRLGEANASETEGVEGGDVA